jgi:hypothetical protein
MAEISTGVPSTGFKRKPDRGEERGGGDFVRTQKELDIA